jgi:cyclopropane-fatty-acyl-phospholipid synthase
MLGLHRAVLGLVERGVVPDAWVRAGIRALLRERLGEIHEGDVERAAELTERFVAEMNAAPVALVPHKANEQHYEVPAEFYAAVLGPRRKYSCCHWPAGVETLAAAEESALAITCEHAELADGNRILELGCGWGSLSLWMAERYRRSEIVAVSNSHSQRAYIQERAATLGLDNLRVVTADMNEFATDDRFDRVVSVEMFEHMRNWHELFRRIHGWLVPGGRFFLHVFCHRSTPYPYEDRGPGDWMSRTFFSGGMMPSDDLALRFQSHLDFVRRWRWSGLHYERTLRAWLALLDTRAAIVRPILARTYGDGAAAGWWVRWRLFFLACAELFAYRGGREWWVSHYLFERPRRMDRDTTTGSC